jgi:hypothetical protein
MVVARYIMGSATSLVASSSAETGSRAPQNDTALRFGRTKRMREPDEDRKI